MKENFEDLEKAQKDLANAETIPQEISDAILRELSFKTTPTRKALANWRKKSWKNAPNTFIGQ